MTSDSVLLVWSSDGLYDMIKFIIMIFRYIFDISKKEAEELRNINKHDVIEWYKTYFKQSSPKCRRLLIRLWGCNTQFKDAEALPESVQVITDPAAFKMSSKFYPSVC